MKFWILQVLIAFDQTINAFFFGWADETMSSRLHRLRRDGKFWGWVAYPVDWFFWCLGDKNHCEMAFHSERLRLQAPPETRV